MKESLLASPKHTRENADDSVQNLQIIVWEIVTSEINGAIRRADRRVVRHERLSKICTSM
jgi:hypothetical protein